MFKSMAAGSIALLAAFVIQPATVRAGTDVDVSVRLHGYPVQYDPGYPTQYPDYDDSDDEDDNECSDSNDHGARTTRGHSRSNQRFSLEVVWVTPNDHRIEQNRRDEP